MSIHVLPFLGNRNYLQGTTLLNALLDVAQNDVPTGASFSFKAARPIFTNHLEFVMSDVNVTKAEAILHYAERTIAVHALPSVKPLAHVPFDETNLCAKASFDAHSVRWRLSPKENAICFSVLLFKNYLLRSRPIKETGQWVFMRMDASLPCPTQGVMRLMSLPEHMPGLAMARVLLTEGNAEPHREKTWGTLYFTWRELKQEKV